MGAVAVPELISMYCIRSGSAISGSAADPSGMFIAGMLGVDSI